ncbi:MAG: ATP-binding protein [Candidatus Korobacteraceae bacterium]
MTDASNWADNNMHYVAASVAWVRSLLESQTRRQKSAPMVLPAPEVEAEQKPGWRQLMRRPQPAPPSTIALPAPRQSESGDSQVSEGASQASSIAAQMSPPPALVLLGQRLGLTPFEQNLLLLCVAMEVDVSIAGLCAQAQADVNRPYPTFALAFALFQNPSWDAISPERPLRYWRLIEINQPGGLPLSVSPLRADERIVNCVQGVNYMDDRLAPLVSALEPLNKAETAPASQQAAADRIITELKGVPANQPLPVVQLLGTDSSSKRFVTGLAANALGLQVYRVHSNLLPTHATELETFARLWERESLLLSNALYVEVDAGQEDAPQSAQISGLLSRISGVVFLDTRESWPGITKPIVLVDVAKPTAAEQQKAWAESLGERQGTIPAQVAGQFNLGLGAIHEIATKLAAQNITDDHQLRDALWSECLAYTRPRFDKAAQRIDAKATWDDLVLPAQEVALLHAVADQVAQRSTVYQEWGFEQKISRGLGITALFAGESGTGKTMAAEVLANELGLNLYRIDLSVVVSKYIGQTEANLRRLFDAAEDGGAILFFDEADALFGKRSEVKDSHDRYANIEINYLLQRMESYRGLAILATNMKSALDPAFLRRLRFVVNMPFPGAAERKAIWQKVFPPQTPVSDLDYDRLARLNITGGHIHNIALNAAFMAAHQGGSLDMPTVLQAARAEFRKLERPINEADFQWRARPKEIVA